MYNLEKCEICPRKCGADRYCGTGYCGQGAKIKIARAAPHYWEEPCISGEHGSGTVFFSGCSLKCCFCQNYKISAENFGKEITTHRLSEIFLELQDKGAHNINLVSPTHYVPQIIAALDNAKAHGLTLPILYNTSGYERSTLVCGRRIERRNTAAIPPPAHETTARSLPRERAFSALRNASGVLFGCKLGGTAKCNFVPCNAHGIIF